MISEKQFNILKNIYYNISEKIINKHKSLLTKLKLVDINYPFNIELIKNNIEIALEPFKIKKAIIFAAGFGSRMMPLTKDCPKPLVKINKKSFIETEIEALLSNDINDIYIVTGYKHEAFNNFEKKYPQAKINFVTNYFYDKGNNIYSAYLIRNQLSNGIVLDGDLYIKNNNLFKEKYFFYSNYVTIFKTKTEDWVLHKDVKNKFVTESSIGGTNVEQMVGISFYNLYDGIKLGHYIECCIKKGNTNCYFDEVATKYYRTKFNLTTRLFTENDVIELDTYDELLKERQKNEKN